MTGSESSWLDSNMQSTGPLARLHLPRPQCAESLGTKQKTFSSRSSARLAEDRFSSPPGGSSRFAAGIEQGESISEACRLELVSYANFRRHVKLHSKYQRRLKDAEETREEFLREFHIANIRKHAPRNVLASLWWLERTLPSRFALKSVHRPEGSSEQPIGDKISEDQLRRYAALMDEFRRENEAKAVV